jgi:hypothetical protein
MLEPLHQERPMRQIFQDRRQRFERCQVELSFRLSAAVTARAVLVDKRANGPAEVPLERGFWLLGPCLGRGHNGAEEEDDGETTSKIHGVR